MPTPITAKLLAGALFAGAAVLTGDVTLLATAGGLGVNWASEALAELGGARLAPGSPLAQASAQALRKAISSLERQFRAEVNANTERKSFALLRATAGSVTEPAYAAGAAQLADLQRTVASSLDELLHDHDEQEVLFLRANLLPATARALRDELDGNDAAWRAFHGRLIEQLHARAAQSGAPTDLAPILQRLDDQQRTLSALRDGDDAMDAVLAKVQALIEQLEQGSQPEQDEITFENRDLKVGGRLQEAVGDIHNDGAVSAGHQATSTRPSRKVTFINDKVEVQGDAQLAAGSIYNQSAHAQGGGAATDRPDARPVLAIFAEPNDRAETHWLREAQVLRGILLPFEQRFPLREIAGCTPDELHIALLTVRPGILHFQGHGTREGLAFADMLNSTETIDWQAMMSTLQSCDTLTCVVLNACESHVHAQVGPQRFHLITTPGGVGAEATRIFTQGFYAALVAGRSVEQAYGDGCNLLHIKRVNRREWPTLTRSQAQ
jgi:hypothetical protein